MPDEPRQLDVIQRWMQAVITHPAGVERGLESDEAMREIDLDPARLGEVVLPSTRLSPVERVRVYAHAYYGRLIDCLREEFAVFAATVGEEPFNEFAFNYLRAHPSRSYTLNELGRSFPRYLEETKPAGDATPGSIAAPDAQPVAFADFLIDLATLEWTINEVFDAPGVEGEPLLSAADLLAVPPQRWAEVKLRPVRCLRLLRLRFPVNGFFTAMRKGGESVSMPQASPEFLAVFRRDFIVRRFELSQPQFALLSALAEGSTLGEAIERAGACWTADDDGFAASLHSWFESWTAAGLIHRVE